METFEETVADLNRTVEDNLAKVTAVAESTRGAHGTAQEELADALAAAGDGLVYFVQAGPGGPVKIGISSRTALRKRIDDLQIGNPFTLRLTRVTPGTRHIEKLLHLIFQPLRMKSEWFYPHPALCEVAWADYDPRYGR